MTAYRNGESGAGWPFRVGIRLTSVRFVRVGGMRINDQFRVCFVWTAQGPEQVEIVDYH